MIMISHKYLDNNKMVKDVNSRDEQDNSKVMVTIVDCLNVWPSSMLTRLPLYKTIFYQLFVSFCGHFSPSSSYGHN